MGDALAWRCKFGVIAPSTNTSVQPDERIAARKEVDDPAVECIIQVGTNLACGMHALDSRRID